MVTFQTVDERFLQRRRVADAADVLDSCGDWRERGGGERESRGGVSGASSASLRQQLIRIHSHEGFVRFGVSARLRLARLDVVIDANEAGTPPPSFPRGVVRRMKR